MAWSFRLGRFFGINVFIHYLLIPFLSLIALSYVATFGIVIAIKMALLLTLIFSCVLFHEFGHSLVAKHYGVTVHYIILTPIGGIANMEYLPTDPNLELKITIAGPLVNFAIALFLAPIALSAHYFWRSDFILYLMTANVVLMLFNLVPIFPMDGGRILRAILTKKMGLLKATQISVQAASILAVCMIIIGFLGNFVLIFIAIFVYIAGKQEQMLVRKIHGHNSDPSLFANYKNIQGIKKALYQVFYRKKL